jgi:hypothetical protein
MKRLIFMILSIIFLSLTALVFAGEVEKYFKEKGLHVAELSEKDKINLQINKLEQAIKQQQIEEFERIFSEDYVETDPSISKSSIKEKLQTIFSDISQTRQFITQTNPNTGWKVTSTQDFYIRNPKIKVEQDKAWVECDIGFFSATKNYKDLRETFSFVQTSRRWLLSSSKNLFSFLEKASKATTKEIGTISSSGETMFQTKDDFVSTHLLIPVILYNYGKTPIPRFNKTESLNWFEVNCMNSPHGIVADVQYTENGPDFTYEFLFVTDVTSQKLIATDQDEWVAEFGTEGSGLGQFWGPHGICDWGGGCYLVADMFNNRVISYYYEKGWDEPGWRVTLTHNFDWPIDVDAKCIQHTEPPPPQKVEYIAVVDHRNHRLVFFHALPYPLGFDRSYGEYGSGEGQFIYPTSVCFGRDPETGWQTNDFFVTDYGNRRLVRLYLQDTGVDTIFWRATYQFPDDVELTSVEVDNKGLVYVLDRRHGKVYKFAPSQAYPFSFSLLGVWGETGTADGQLEYPNVLTVAHGRYCPYPNPCVPFPNMDWFLGDVFVSESWGDQTGIRRFVIATDILNPSADYVPYNEDTGEGNFIWYTYHLTDFADNVTEQVFRGAELCTTYSRGSLNWGSQGGEWTVGGHPHGETYTVKITATSIYGPTVEKTVDVYVDTMTTHNPVITRGIRVKHENTPYWCEDDPWQCIKEGYSYTVDVLAFDPDGDSLTYEWSCGSGWLNYYYKRITTSENYVCYTAPVFDKNGNESTESLESFTHPDFIGVNVTNPYGGEASTSELFTVYEPQTSCLCGDAKDDGTINSADIVFLINYLYKGGPAPYPYEKADVNNDCVVNSADITYLLNYLSKYGPLPECCWIH